MGFALTRPANALVVVALLMAVGAPAAAAVRQGAGDDATTYRGDMARTGRMPGPNPTAHEVLWRFDSPTEVIDHFAATGETLYVDDDVKLYALDAVTYDERWQIDSVGDFMTVAGGRLFVQGGGNLTALDAERGEVLWQTNPGPGGRFSHPAVAENTVIAIFYDTVVALDAASGEERWRVIADEWVGVTGSPALSGDTVYVASEGVKGLMALDVATGAERWRVEWEGLAPHGILAGPTPAVAGDTVYLATGGDVYAVAAADGAERWHLALAADAFAAMKTASSLAVVGDLVVVAADSQEMYAPDRTRLLALDAVTGEVRWELADSAEAVAAPVVADGVIYVLLYGSLAVSMDGLFAIEASTGEVLWSDPAIERGALDFVEDSAAVVGGVIYVDGEELIALGDAA